MKYLYKDPLNKIRKFILSNSGSLDDANDVFQDAIVTLFHYVKTDKYKEEYDLDGFLFRVAKNAWIDRARKNKKLVNDELKNYDVSDGTDQLADLISKERLEIFHELFNQLEERCRQLLQFIIFEKRSLQEAADTLGYKDVNVAKSQHYRCKKYFSKIITDNKEALSALRN